MLTIKSKPLSNYTFIDLFAGLGGFRLAMESFGATCVYSNEWEKNVQKVYQKNFGETPEGDITKVDEKSIPKHDILCAGFPCQAFSISGKQKGFQDRRGILFFDVARIVQYHKPKIVFMENVKHFANHDSGKTLATVKTTMEKLGYDFYSDILNAADYGIPQKRERIYMVCLRKDLRLPKFIFPPVTTLKKHVSDILLPETTETSALYVTRNDVYMNGKKDESYSDKIIRLGIVNKGGQGERIYSTKGIAITLSANGGGVFARTGGYFINGKARKLLPRECARLMGFPDNYVLDNNPNQAYKQLGNSVVLDVLQYILIQLSKLLGYDVQFTESE